MSPDGGAAGLASHPSRSHRPAVARARKLIVDDEAFWFSVRHEHGMRSPEAETPPRDSCRERLAIWRDGRRKGSLVVTFVGGEGRVVGDGVNPSGVVVRWLGYLDGSGAVPHGVVARPDGVLNLHRPGVARAVLDEAVARGWDTMSASELDGWSLFDAVVERLGPDNAYREQERQR